MKREENQEFAALEPRRASTNVENVIINFQMFVTSLYKK
jgi:hypothetical protein